MTQPEIMKLLNEAASPDCTIERRMEIGDVLERAACPEGFPAGTFTVMTGGARLNPSHYRSNDVARLYRMMATDCPDLLPRQAAYFLYACRGSSRETINWSLIL